MKLYLVDERPSVLLAARAPESGLPVVLVDVAVAHVDHMGNSGVAKGKAVQAAQLQMQGRWTQIQGLLGFAATAANENRTAPKPIGGARGVPPRGRPV